MALTEEGLVIERQPEILENIAENERTNIHPEIVTTNETIVGQQNIIVSTQLADIQALLEAVNDNFNIAKASGTNLDDLALLRNKTRLAATKTAGSADFTGTNGAFISLDSIVENPLSGDRYVTDSDITITTLACTSAQFSVATVSNSTAYTVTVQATDYTYNSDVDATATEIVVGLKALIDADGAATWTATLGVGDTLIIADTITISVSFTGLLAADSVTSSGNITAVEAGAILAPAGTVNTIITAASGWVSVVNSTQLVTGRAREEDTDLRVRISSTSVSVGSVTVDGIENNVESVSGVAGATVVENDSLITDGEGREGKSFEVIVEGGSDLDIAQAIWDSKGAGIKTVGDLSAFAVDRNGTNRLMFFSRPTLVNIAVRVTFSKYAEETFPVLGVDTIKTIATDHVNALTTSTDLIPGRMEGPIYAGTTGIGDMTVEVQQLTNQGDTPVPASWQETVLPLSLSQKASTVVTDVYVVEL